MQQDVIVQEMIAKNVNQETATLIVSWGMDGSTGHSMYRHWVRLAKKPLS
jgi:hypothetical protein